MTTIKYVEKSAQNPHIFQKTTFLMVVGLSALAEGPMDSRSFVRLCVRASVTRYLEIRAPDFSETWHKVASWQD